MIQRLIRKLELKLKPLKEGEVLYGDCTDFNMSSGVTQVLHGLRTREGDLSHSYWRGADTYRITITDIVSPLYIYVGEVLTKEVGPDGEFVWMERVYSNSIKKKELQDMILEGRLTRSKS